jgi:hypothetical protein
LDSFGQHVKNDKRLSSYQETCDGISDHLGVSAKAATCDAVSSPTRNAPVKQPNCKPALFSHHFGRSSEISESPRFNNGTASANEDVCKNGCVSKEQQVCIFLRDGNKISLGQQHLKQPGCWISLPHGYTVIHHKNTVEYSQQIDEHGYVTPKKTTEHKNPFVSWVDFSPPWLQHRRHFAPSP